MQIFAYKSVNNISYILYVHGHGLGTIQLKCPVQPLSFCLCPMCAENNPSSVLKQFQNYSQFTLGSSCESQVGTCEHAY